MQTTRTKRLPAETTTDYRTRLLSTLFKSSNNAQRCQTLISIIRALDNKPRFS